MDRLEGRDGHARNIEGNLHAHVPAVGAADAACEPSNWEGPPTGGYKRVQAKRSFEAAGLDFNYPTLVATLAPHPDLPLGAQRLA